MFMLGRLTRKAFSDRAVMPMGKGESSRTPSLKPYGLAGQPSEYAAAAVFTLAVLLVFLVDTRTKESSEITAIDLIAVIAAAWLLSTPLTLWIVGLSIGLVTADAVSGDLRPVTAAVEAAVFVILALAVRFYAARLRSVLEGADGEKAAAIVANVFGLENLAHLVDASGDGVAAVDVGGRVRYANAAAGELLGLSTAPEPNPRLIDQVVAEDRPRVLSDFVTAGLDRAGSLSFRVTGRDGVQREVEVNHTPFFAKGRQVMALVIRDVTDVRRLQFAAGVLAETAANLAVTQPLETTLEAVARRVVEVSQASACAVFLLEADRTLRMVGSWGLPDGYGAAAFEAFKTGADMPALEALRTKAPVFVDDLPSRIRTEAQFANMRTVSQGVPWRLAIAMPMIHREQALGVLAVYFAAGRRPDGPTMNFLNAIAGQAASAAQVSRLVAAAQGEIAGEERHRLSRELHDSLSQALYGIVLGAKSAQKRLATDPGHLAEPLDYIVDLAEAALGDMRSLVLELRPESLEKEGLIVALSQCANGINSRYGLDISRELPYEPDLPRDLKLLTYRVVQEALHNVVKHGHAEHAALRVEVENDCLAIEVTDDGEGFDPNASFTGHFGLESMRERVKSRGGEISIESSRGHGTAVRVRVPIVCESATVVGDRR
jgi:PAS domain S-box-containing protein